MTRLVLDIPQSQDVPLLLALLKRLNVRVVQKSSTPSEQAQADDMAKAFSLSDFQEAMEMTDEDMVLTFGEEYLLEHKWQSSYA
ncbi:MAG: hypothetical protein H7246_16465 [Phycisphaerae bacterium]|nr:hypothetical protein [Saprospiraceae bacterium]